jgi:hypothetical protein
MSNNHLSKDNQIAITAALAEGNSIRPIERMTGIHRDTILLDQKMQNLDCHRIDLDEVWGFIGKRFATSARMIIRPLATFGRSAQLT